MPDGNIKAAGYGNGTPVRMLSQKKKKKNLGLQTILKPKGKNELKYEEGIDWEHKRSLVRDMKDIVKLGRG